MSAKVVELRPGSTGEPSDADLVRACGDGDEGALGRLYDRHQGVVWRFVARVVGPASKSDVDDLVQSTFLEVWRSAPRFAGRSQVRTWILGIAHNLVRRHFRSSARRRAALTVLADNTPAPVDAEGALERRLLLQKMQVALQELSSEQRATFVLCDLEGVRGVDAAKILGVRPGTVWRRLHEARKQLRASLQGDRT